MTSNDKWTSASMPRAMWNRLQKKHPGRSIASIVRDAAERYLEMLLTESESEPVREDS